MMENKFTITIHDANGARQFTMHKIIKKVIFYGGLSTVLLSIIAVTIALILKSTLDTTELKKKQMEQANERLAADIDKTDRELQIKQQELVEVADRLHEVQELIGLTPVQKEMDDAHIEIAQLTFEQVGALFKYIPSGSPVEYQGITSKFGYRIHPTLKRKEFHRGSDLRAAMNTPVHAPADGVIEYGGYNKKSGYGRLVILDHNYGFKTYYGHLNKILVKSGNFVKKGDVIAYTGSSGMSNGPHLHYEVRFLQRVLNPYWFIKWSAEDYGQIFKKEKWVPWRDLITAITKDLPPHIDEPFDIETDEGNMTEVSQDHSVDLVDLISELPTNR